MSIQAANIQPLTLKTLSHQQATLNNLACGQPLQLQSQIHDAPCTISLLPIVATRQFDIELQLSIDGLPVRVQLAKELFSSVIIGGTSLRDLVSQLPDELRQGCINAALERLLADLRAALQRDIQLRRIGHCEHISEGTPCLGLQFHDGVSSIHGLLIVNDQIRSQLQGLFKNSNSAVSSAAMAAPADHIAMPLSLEVGHTVIADTRLQQLASGDIVLMDRCWYRDGKHIFLRISETEGYLGALKESRLTLKQRIKQGLESGMSDDFDDFDDLDDDFDLGDDFDEDLSLDEPPHTAASKPTTAAPAARQAQTPASQPAPQQITHKDIQGLPVKLTFDIGQQELTVGDMGHIGPGYTFELNRDISSPVTMKANGKPFAECELVNINNQLGARIVRLL